MVRFTPPRKGVSTILGQSAFSDKPLALFLDGVNVKVGAVAVENVMLGHEDKIKSDREKAEATIEKGDAFREKERAKIYI